MSVTITELARQLGVSPMTVSRALRGVGRIGPDTRIRILDAARKAGYRPNASARAMRSGRTGCVALLLSSSHALSYLPQELVSGIADALEEHKLYLTICRLPENSSGRVPAVFSQWLAEGMLVNYTHHIPAGIVDEIESQPVPAIWINFKRRADCVYPADEAAARAGTEHLIALGHRRIAYADLTEYAEEPLEFKHYSTVDRFNGYAAAMHAAGLPLLRWYGQSGTERIALCRELLARPERPTAVLTYNKYSAGPLGAAALGLGLSLPRDVALITFEVEPFLELGRVVGTLRLPEHRMGELAVELLRRRMSLREALPPQEIPIPAELDYCVGPKA